MPTLDQLNAQLDRLASFEAGPFPVLSVYLDLRPDEVGRDRFEPFLRRELSDRVSTYPASGPERKSLQDDAERIQSSVTDVDASLNGLAIFSCSGSGLFEAVPLAAPVGDHRLFISDLPHLYPLAKVMDEYPRYLALVADTNAARIVVFAMNAVEKSDRIEGVKTRRHSMGGWSQARYQRHTENYHLHHAKEVVDAVARIVRDERIEKIVVAGDDVIVPMLREQFPKDIAERIVDVVKVGMHANEREVLDKTIAALQQKDAETDRERVDQLLGAYRANGLACVGLAATKRAFELGQVDELLVPGSADVIRGVDKKPGDTQPERSAEERAADELIVLARQTSARVRFIEDAALLEPAGGVGAFLRFKI